MAPGRFRPTPARTPLLKLKKGIKVKKAGLGVKLPCFSASAGRTNSILRHFRAGRGAKVQRSLSDDFEDVATARRSLLLKSPSMPALRRRSVSLSGKGAMHAPWLLHSLSAEPSVRPPTPIVPKHRSLDGSLQQYGLQQFGLQQQQQQQPLAGSRLAFATSDAPGPFCFMELEHLSQSMESLAVTAADAAANHLHAHMDAPASACAAEAAASAVHHAPTQHAAGPAHAHSAGWAPAPSDSGAASWGFAGIAAAAAAVAAQPGTALQWDVSMGRWGSCPV